MPTRVKVKEWGDGMAVLIPNRFAKTRKIRVGTVLDIEPVRVVNAPPRRRYTLAELMKRFSPKHRHGEWNLGEPVGREIW